MKRSWIAPIVIVTIAFASGWFWGFQQRPELLVDDARHYATIASSIANDGIVSLNGTDPTMKREVGYPALLSLWINNSDPITTTVVVQIALFSFLCLGVFYFFRKQHEKEAFIAALLIALAPPIAYFTGQVLTETLFTVLLIFSLLSLVRSLQLHSWKYATVAGLLCGCALLTRSVLLLFPLFFLILTILFWRTYWKQAVVFCATALLVLLPWSLRNHILFDSFSPTSGGSHLLLVRGLRTELSLQEKKQLIYYTTIGSSAAIQPDTTYGQEAQSLVLFADARNFERFLAKKGLDDGQIDNVQMHLALSYIKTHPLTYLAFNALEFVKLNAPPVSTLWALPATIPIHLLITVIYLFLYVIALLMLWRLSRSNNHNWQAYAIVFGGFLLYYNAFSSFFDAIPRYNVPLLPLYLILFTFWYTDGSIWITSTS